MFQRVPLPSEKTVRTWAMDPEHPFSTQYARAREVGYMKMADDLLDIADDASDDYQRSRLRVDARKWLLSKALPKIFGDKLQSKVSGKDGVPIAVIRRGTRACARGLKSMSPAVQAGPWRRIYHWEVPSISRILSIQQSVHRGRCSKIARQLWRRTENPASRCAPRVRRAQEAGRCCSTPQGVRKSSHPDVVRSTRLSARSG